MQIRMLTVFCKKSLIQVYLWERIPPREHFKKLILYSKMTKFLKLRKLQTNCRLLTFLKLTLQNTWIKIEINQWTLHKLFLLIQQLLQRLLHLLKFQQLSPPQTTLFQFGTQVLETIQMHRLPTIQLLGCLLIILPQFRTRALQKIQHLYPFKTTQFHQLRMKTASMATRVLEATKLTTIVKIATRVLETIQQTTLVKIATRVMIVIQQMQLQRLTTLNKFITGILVAIHQMQLNHRTTLRTTLVKTATRVLEATQQMQLQQRTTLRTTLTYITTWALQTIHKMQHQWWTTLTKITIKIM